MAEEDVEQFSRTIFTKPLAVYLHLLRRPEKSPRQPPQPAHTNHTPKRLVGSQTTTSKKSNDLGRGDRPSPPSPVPRFVASLLHSHPIIEITRITTNGRGVPACAKLN